MKPDGVRSKDGHPGIEAGARPTPIGRMADAIPHKPLDAFALAGDVLIAVLASGAAVLIRWLLFPWIGYHFPFALLFCANAIAAWYGGYRTGLLAAALGYLAEDYLFFSRDAARLGTSIQYVGIAVYVL